MASALKIEKRGTVLAKAAARRPAGCLRPGAGWCLRWLAACPRGVRVAAGTQAALGL